MKNLWKTLGMITLMVFVVFSFSACDNPSDGDDDVVDGPVTYQSTKVYIGDTATDYTLDVPANGKIVITYSDDIKPLTPSASVKVMKQGDTPDENIDVTVNGNKIIITNFTVDTSATVYTKIELSGIKGKNDENLDKVIDFPFTTLTNTAALISKVVINNLPVAWNGKMIALAGDTGYGHFTGSRDTGWSFGNSTWNIADIINKAGPLTVTAANNDVTMDIIGKDAGRAFVTGANAIAFDGYAYNPGDTTITTASNMKLGYANDGQENRVRVDSLKGGKAYYVVGTYGSPYWTWNLVEAE